MMKARFVSAVGLALLLPLGLSTPAWSGGYIWDTPTDTNWLSTTSTTGWIVPPNPNWQVQDADSSGAQETVAESQIAGNDAHVVYSLAQQEDTAPYGQTALSISGTSDVAFHPQTGQPAPPGAQSIGTLGADFYGTVAYSDSGSQTALNIKLMMEWTLADGGGPPRALTIQVFKNGGTTPIVSMVMNGGTVVKRVNGTFVGQDTLGNASGSDTFDYTDNSAVAGDEYRIHVNGANSVGVGTDTMSFSAALDFSP